MMLSNLLNVLEAQKYVGTLDMSYKNQHGLHLDIFSFLCNFVFVYVGKKNGKVVQIKYRQKRSTRREKDKVNVERILQTIDENQ